MIHWRSFIFIFSYTFISINSDSIISKFKQCDSTFAWQNSSSCTNTTMLGTYHFNVSFTVIDCTDPRYIDVQQHANNLFLKSNANFIVFPQNTQDIIEILNQAIRNNLRPTIRSGGHCFEDFWTNNTGGVLIDLSLMNRISRPCKNDDFILVEPGVLLGDLYTTLYKDYGLIVPGGVCPDIAIGGHVLGAGYGFLARKFGLISDYVHSMEIVHVNKDKSVRAVTVGRNSTRASERDLFWALRGGGSQNFGILSKIIFSNLPISPPLVIWTDFNWKLNALGQSRFNDIITRYVQFFVNNSRTDNPYCDLFTDFNLHLGSDGGTANLRILAIGDRSDLIEGFLKSIGVHDKPTDCQKMSMYRYLFMGFTTGKPSYYLRKSAYMKGPLPISQRDALWHYFTNKTLYGNVTSGGVLIRSYGCAVSTVAGSATAYAHRSAVIKMEFLGGWSSPNQEDGVRDWARRVYADLYGLSGPIPDDTMDGCYYNYPDRELDNVNWRELYFKDNYEQLRKVKRMWDPLNVFWHRQSIEL